ncbi:translation initiation factor IF-2-like [Pyrgilauda ruficollis]|uniref:translation initiation factor IF-2-like n=1 Tax=Pyrgilauda ruficollis TaxID=221976 RepID=UPI001B85D764|nr:translation initiation factor IF-2-like [Pyrgilauda ruficollis]
MELPAGCDPPPPNPARHRWAPVRSGCGSASTICSGTSSDGGSHGCPCPASSRGDNDPHPANPPTLPWHGGLRGLPPVAAVPACRCQLPRRRRPSPACSAGTAPTPRAPGSPSPGDGTDIPHRRHPRAHRAAGASARGPSVLFLAGLGLEGGYTTPRQCQQPGDLAPRRLHRGHPGSPSRAGGRAVWGAQGTPAWPVEMEGLPPRPGSIPAAPSRTGKPLGPAPRRTGLNWCGGGEAGLGLGWQRLARAGEAMGGEQAGAGRSGQGPRSGAAGAGASGQATAGLVPVPIPAGPPRRPVSRGRVVWQPPARPPAAALGALASAAGGPFPTRPARGWLRSPPSTARTGTPQPPNPEDVRTRPSWWDQQ